MEESFAFKFYFIIYLYKKTPICIPQFGWNWYGVLINYFEFCNAEHY